MHNRHRFVAWREIAVAQEAQRDECKERHVPVEASLIMTASSSTRRAATRSSRRVRLGLLWNPLVFLMAILLGAPVLAATKRVQVGPNGLLVFADEETGTNTTVIAAGDTVEWVWASSGHSTTRPDTPRSWDSGIQDMPFTFSQTFPSPGTFPYFCIPHQALGMVGMVVVKPVAVTTTTIAVGTTSTTVPLAPSVAQAFASLDQDVQTLLDQVTTAASADVALGTSLSGLLDGAKIRLEQAKAQLTAGERGNAKRSLTAANRLLSRFKARLGSSEGRRQIAASIRNGFIASVGTVQGNVRSLRKVI
jgi:plastocyanin